jgi:hypothetical protein
MHEGPLRQHLNPLPRGEGRVRGGRGKGEFSISLGNEKSRLPTAERRRVGSGTWRQTDSTVLRQEVQIVLPSVGSDRKIPGCE